ncbi:hypothetical protein BS50DRAFT_575247 [Corynespora cassiicola Philippines]|uniref:CENP-V/GFA domain-containing protein n=1 Tax=Corynespora cassiicola Philippines TaxID=1448308 RepID=A0A2T2NIC1_CORCC|nr:hypothetical protein BS50DRAFT_575247 [Corynespora cassiicola Philippines]
MAQPKNPFTGDPKSHPISEFEQGMRGTCLCKSISITIKDPELFTKRRGHLCHCSNCRKISGSYVAANFAIEKEKVEFHDEKGTWKEYEDWETGSGKVVLRCFCSNCGSPITSKADFVPNMVFLKMGLFPRIPTPEAESFAAHKNDWEGSIEGAVQYETVRGGKKLGE